MADAAKTPKTLYVRIKPSNQKETHTAHGVTIHKSGGWYEVPYATARLLEKERMNVLNPEAGAFVFDVKTKAEAEEVVHEETVVADPAGTLERPRVVTPREPEPEAPAAQRGRGKGGKAAKES